MCGSIQDYPDYTMLPIIDTVTEARLREQYAELCDEDALPTVFSGRSADVPWTSIAEEQHDVCDPMIDVAPGERQPAEWTVPRAFGQYIRGDSLQVCTPPLLCFIRRSTYF